ncbi:RalA-binding protein 1 [Fasciolopsis buskii]|uniref:RalA-binding protein 1 n=1 Tax=Fasciolopsis buskii TaxID=27845 RepID=A0A8E0RVV9_9TREM|nr:RalA-binding protein 1 [Fasciolopsis buski]
MSKSSVIYSSLILDISSEPSFPVPTSSSSVAPSQCVPSTCSTTTTKEAILATTVCALSDTSNVPVGDNGPLIEHSTQPVISAPVESDVLTASVVEQVSTKDQVYTMVLSDSPPSTPPPPPPPPPPPVSEFLPVTLSPTLEDFSELLRKPDLEVSTSLRFDSVTESPPATVKAIDLHRAAKLEHPFVNLSLSPLPSDVCFTSVNVCPDFVVSEPALINGEAQTEKLESGGRNALYQIALYEARKLELNAIQADLRARIRSEQAEISQIQSQIRHLLETGGSRVRRLYESEFASVARYMKPNDVISVPSSMEQSPRWLARSWTRIADLLNSESGGHLSDEPEACLMDDDSDESSESACHMSGDERARSHLLSDSVANGSGREHSDSKSRKSGYVSYVILVDQDEEKRSNVNLPGVVGDQLDAAERSLEVSSDFKLTNKESFCHPTTEQNDDANASIVPSGAHNGNDQEEEDDDDDDEDDEEDEVELARTLHQLTLDNARLVQLNARYLEGIQAERNRCAELKVLLKMRTIRGNSISFQLKESPTSVE